MQIESNTDIRSYRELQVEASAQERYLTRSLESLVQGFQEYVYRTFGSGLADVPEHAARTLLELFSFQLQCLQTAYLGDSQEKRGWDLSYDLMAVRTFVEEALLGRWGPSWGEKLLEVVKHSTRELQGRPQRRIDGDTLRPLRENFNVRVYNSDMLSVPEEVEKALARVCEDLVINPDVYAPQKGFGRLVPREEIERFISIPHSQLIVVEDSAKVAGLYLFSPGLAGAPEGASDLVEKMLPVLDLNEFEVGWVHLIGISKETRQRLIQEKLSPHHYVHNVLLEAAISRKLRFLCLAVRGGLQANLAKLSYEKSGWKVLGTFQDHGVPYYVMYANPAKLLSNGPYESMILSCPYGTDDSQQKIFGDAMKDFAPNNPGFKRLPTIERGAVTEVVHNWEFGVSEKLGHKVECKVLPMKFASGTRLYIVEVQDGHYASIGIMQKLSNLDCWKLEEFPYYELGQFEPLRSLAECLELYRQRLK